MTQNATLITALNMIQVLVSIGLVVVIILQAKGSGIGNLLGGGDTGLGIAKTRRGLEKTLFQITIFLAGVFLIVAIIRLMLQN
ncbi:MAG TPA: preprotein translocase subunit SecG [Aggregatilineales bacterium]|nr:preprotein translocase subunit SecG [Anaerolineales bacterium]HRE48620.1 preprotein translocase subunit SecG [Aggregatilineales bacterium]